MKFSIRPPARQEIYRSLWVRDSTGFCLKSGDKLFRKDNGKTAEKISSEKSEKILFNWLRKSLKIKAFNYL